MREILFRAKRIDNGEWIEGGFYLEESHDLKADSMYIIVGTLDCVGCAYKVIPETVGQYIGLTDKNGKKIFEGDIVKCTDALNGIEFMAVVLFGNPNGEYNWGFQLKKISGDDANTDILLWAEMEESGAYIEALGNIFDNPELLGGDGE